MKVIITESQYKKIVYNFLDSLFGPNYSYKRLSDNKTVILIFGKDTSDDIFRVYTKFGRGEGCKKDLYVNDETMDTIQNYIPISVIKKKLFSKTILSYVNEKTKLNIDCIDFYYNIEIDDDDDNILRVSRYNFNVKKNKKIKPG